jgi:hypothetical protein
VAVGFALGSLTANDPEQTPVAATLSHGSWVIEALPLPFDNANNESDDIPSLRSVSCQSSRSCVAVGSYFSSYGNQKTPLTEILANGKWKQVSYNTSGGGFLDGVSCFEKGSCLAVGASAAETPLIETFSSSYWQGTQVPVPDGDSGMVLQSVSCPPNSLTCIAVGEEANARWCESRSDKHRRLIGRRGSGCEATPS